MRTRDTIRTCTVLVLSQPPPTVGLPGHEWSVGESNPADPACKARLHTSAHPSEPVTRIERAPSCVRSRRTTFSASPAWSRRPGSNRLPPGYKPGAPPRGASSAWCPRRDSNAHCRPPHDRASCQIGLRGHRAGSGGFEPPVSWFRARRVAGLHQLPSRPAEVRRPVQRWASDAHDGAVGLTRSTMPASAGVRSPLRWLHGPHAATVFFHVFLPPCDRGTMWSTVVAWESQ